MDVPEVSQWRGLSPLESTQSTGNLYLVMGSLTTSSLPHSAATWRGV